MRIVLERQGYIPVSHQLRNGLCVYAGGHQVCAKAVPKIVPANQPKARGLWASAPATEGHQRLLGGHLIKKSMREACF
jgi:hypothetical protein